MTTIILTDRSCKRCDAPIPASAHFNAKFCPTCQPIAREERLKRNRRTFNHDYSSRGNLTNKEGAERLRRQITAYWAERGHTVKVEVINQGFDNSARGARYDVRSDMKNGLPR